MPRCRIKTASRRWKRRASSSTTYTDRWRPPVHDRYWHVVAVLGTSSRNFSMNGNFVDNLLYLRTATKKARPLRRAVRAQCGVVLDSANCVRQHGSLPRGSVLEANDSNEEAGLRARVDELAYRDEVNSMQSIV